MNANDKAVSKKIVRDFVRHGTTSCGMGALDIAAGLLGADDVEAVVTAAKAGLEAKGVLVNGPGLTAT